MITPMGITGINDMVINSVEGVNIPNCRKNGTFAIFMLKKNHALVPTTR